ncbi:MAG: HIT family protein [Planctomycetota bacterium]|nr:HIT family protein [Planctomycetota bacterium]
MPSIFTKILAGEIPCAKVWEDECFFAFLDIMPVAPGHTLVITKQEVNYLFDMDEKLYLDLMAASRKVAKMVKAATGCQRVCVGAFGFEVPHVHIHLFPLDGLNQFPFPKREKANPADLDAMAKKIAAQA